MHFHQVNATEPVSDLVYQVMSKGDIVLSRSIRASGPDTSTFELQIPITPNMAPKSRLLVYYIRPSTREIVADALNFKVDGVFRTPVHLASNGNQTKPGGKVDLTIHTNPSAYVGLLGVDQSVLLLKSGNDITQSAVMAKLEAYDTGKQTFRPYNPFTSPTASELFQDSGVVILTNGLVHSHYRGKRKYANSGERSIK